MAPTPRPGTTIQVPIPRVPSVDEQKATNWAAGNGKLIAALLLTVIAVAVVRWVWKSVQFRVLLGIGVALFVGYLIWGR